MPFPYYGKGFYATKRSLDVRLAVHDVRCAAGAPPVLLAAEGHAAG